jgi:hypothetical protein
MKNALLSNIQCNMALLDDTKHKRLVQSKQCLDRDSAHFLQALATCKVIN